MRQQAGLANHARAREDVPAEADAIAILNLAPLLLQGLVVHGAEAERLSIDVRQG